MKKIQIRSPISKTFYARFGFQRAFKYGLRSQWDGVPDGAFMAMLFNESTLKDVSGVV
jgi:predicted N-acetyltransferase YhbS